jgi:hypothetical protein
VRKLHTIKTVRDRVERAESTSLTKEVGTWIAASLGLIAFISAALALLGFGVAIAAGGTFGASMLRVADSPFHCLKLSSFVFIQILSRMDANESFLPTDMGYELVFSLLTIVGIALFLALIFLSYLVRRNFFISETKAKVTKAYAARLTTHGLGKLLSSVFWMRNKRGIYALPIGLAFGLLGVIAIKVIKSVLMFIPLLVVIIPIVGYTVGKQYFYEATIEPDECVQLINANSERAAHERARYAQETSPKPKPQKWGATCLVVKKLDNQEIARGRLVVEIPDAVLLYSPKTGESEFIPIKDARVAKISSLK